MMMSLFSMFDPSAAFNMPLNWMIMILTILMIPLQFWMNKSRISNFFNMMLKSLHKEFSALFTKTILMKGSTLMPITLFIMIFLNNISSNFPYNFCSSAHLSFSMSLSIPIWMSIILFFWMNLTKTMLSHLVPTGTPNMLMPLMVLIELTSNIIRPMALAVRLTANLIAGHLLMALLGNTMNITSIYWPMIMLIQTMFLMFELMVAIIQSYVFSVLMTLYSSEIY
uniref:ATP synthase subunit a n=1 Tax=Paracarsidara gigantea TaxID=2218136 RepID=A0A344A2L2_9HEMI|nr:ATP synthase F0 subunit 6 [Paracarsidara gigantea]AWU49003.1 ATP synthase F0 subunit 6 [Paracarsidara gigantea]